MVGKGRIWEAHFLRAHFCLEPKSQVGKFRNANSENWGSDETHIEVGKAAAFGDGTGCF